MAVMTKRELRESYKQQRTKIEATDLNKWEDLMLINFQKLPIGAVQTILTYAPFEKYNEFDPTPITDYCAFRNPGLLLCFPVADTASLSLSAVAVDDNTYFAPNSYGIDEPMNADIVPPDEIDLVLLPLLAYDKRGYRVGYGKGYYDRFLKQCSPETLKIGFSFFEAEEAIDDINEHDVKMDFCITPNHLYEF
jgi:5-formyltetrahydrofolate cyclo-ligase